MKKQVEEKKEIIEKVKDFLQNLQTVDEDFRKGVVHEKVVNGISDEWDNTNGFGSSTRPIPFIPKRKRYGIDVVGKTTQYGRILLAIEVDRGSMPYYNWSKLIDIRSKNKIWVYLTNKPRARAERIFQNSVKELRKILQKRNENKDECGNFVAMMKTPNELKTILLYD